MNKKDEEKAREMTMNKQDEEKAIELSSIYEIYEAKDTDVYHACLEMAAWKQEQIIQKAVEWLNDNQRAYREYDESGFYHEKSQHFIEDFKKAMEVDE